MKKIIENFKDVFKAIFNSITDDNITNMAIMWFVFIGVFVCIPIFLIAFVYAVICVIPYIFLCLCLTTLSLIIPLLIRGCFYFYKRFKEIKDEK